MTTELERAIAQIRSASTPEDLFGRPTGDKNARHRARSKIFARLGRVVHPDRCPPSDQALATEALLRLRELYGLAEGEAPPVKITVQSKKQTYRVERIVKSDDLSILYSCSLDDGTKVLMSTCRDARNNDLYRAEARSIRLLRTPDRPEASGFFPFFPKVLDSFEFAEGGGRVRAANVYADWSQYRSLEEVRSAYPIRIGARHVAWIWRQLLMALGYAHARGVVHGGVLPARVFVDPVNHDLVLTGWFASVNLKAEPSSHIPVVSPDYADWYPREVAAKTTPTPATDIAMAARCMIYLLNGNPLTGRITDPTVPARLIGTLQACILPGAASRPQDAWALRKQFTVLIEELWGPRKRVVLDMPKQ